ncbi:MAG: mechanosensitive ion channel domain-containing protein [Thermoprotei archaeon]|jgi:small-conductance mechanosensitive channel
MPRTHKAIGKIIFYFIMTAIVLSLVSPILGYVKPFLISYFDITTYTPYISSIIIIIFGYLIITSIASLFYETSKDKIGAHNANLIKTLIKILGIAIILSILTSVFNVSAASALTIGSFTGLVIGFATQQVLGQAVAGIFLLFSRPFKPGDKIIVAGQRGTVQEIDIMYTIILSEDGKNQILIPNGSIVGQIIVKNI